MSSSIRHRKLAEIAKPFMHDAVQFSQKIANPRLQYLLTSLLDAKNPPSPERLENAYRNAGLPCPGSGSYDGAADWLSKEGMAMPKHVVAGHFNSFNVKAEMVLIDLLTDSGTGCRTDWQKSFISAFEEIPDSVINAYAGSPARKLLNDVVEFAYGKQFAFFLALQGRAAESLLINSMFAGSSGKERLDVMANFGAVDPSALSMMSESGIFLPGDIILSNRPFDTTKGWIENGGLKVVSLTPFATPQRLYCSDTIFLGDIPMGAFREKYESSRITPKAVLLTVTDNGGGGQPVSMKNVMEASEFAHEHGMVVWIDACRISENAQYIQNNEPGYRNKSLREIQMELLSHADVVTISFKKSWAETGGAILINRESKILKRNYPIMTQFIQEATTSAYGMGFDSYCGVPGREMLKVAAGILQSMDSDLVMQRLMQPAMARVNLRKHSLGGEPFPVVSGGHALYTAADMVLPNVALGNCPAEYLQAIILASVGVRGCGLGNIVYGKWEYDGQNNFFRLVKNVEMDSLRHAIPRNSYSDGHLAILEAAGIAYSEGVFKDLSGGVVPTKRTNHGFDHFFDQYVPQNLDEFYRTVEAVKEIAMSLAK
jgi:tryptophanase